MAGAAATAARKSAAATNPKATSRNQRNKENVPPPPQSTSTTTHQPHDPSGAGNDSALVNIIERMGRLEKKLQDAEAENQRLRTKAGECDSNLFVVTVHDLLSLAGDTQRLHSGCTHEAGDEDEGDQDAAAGVDEVARLTAALAAAENARKELEEKLKNTASLPATSDESAVEEGIVGRPSGTAGQDYSIQVKMGLAGSSKKNKIYQGLLRYMWDLGVRGGLDWQLPWADISATEKAKVFQVARKAHPFLKRFHNDWATEEMLKQYFRNKRKNAYRNGWLDVPAKYSHLKANANKRSQSGSRTKKAKVVLAAKKAKKASKSKGRVEKGTSRGPAGVADDEGEEDMSGIDDEHDDDD
ncbi:hypothetical protein BKA70DRAFT_1426098 [Coprinopsis sp. MPI-PUGE-AT-0042]|nr:hypothetical protein BKA70DRAFT_1426098 [Coprinopsis sp. MPI-PUGE-AT-0042]